MHTFVWCACTYNAFLFGVCSLLSHSLSRIRVHTQPPTHNLHISFSLLPFVSPGLSVSPCLSVSPPLCLSLSLCLSPPLSLSVSLQGRIELMKSAAKKVQPQAQFANLISKLNSKPSCLKTSTNEEQPCLSHLEHYVPYLSWMSHICPGHYHA